MCMAKSSCKRLFGSEATKNRHLFENGLKNRNPNCSQDKMICIKFTSKRCYSPGDMGYVTLRNNNPVILHDTQVQLLKMHPHTKLGCKRSPHMYIPSLPQILLWGEAECGWVGGGGGVVSNWILTFCQSQSITSRQSNSIISKCAFQNSCHINPFFKSIHKTKHTYTNIIYKFLRS